MYGAPEESNPYNVKQNRETFDPINRKSVPRIWYSNASIRMHACCCTRVVYLVAPTAALRTHFIVKTLPGTALSSEHTINSEHALPSRRGCFVWPIL